MKNNQKCIRISDKTLGYIESFDGSGFNQKLENMTDYFMAQEKRMKKRVTDLEAEERKLLESIDKLRRMERNLASIKRYLDDAKKVTDNAQVQGQLKIV